MFFAHVCCSVRTRVPCLRQNPCSCEVAKEASGRGLVYGQVFQEVLEIALWASRTPGQNNSSSAKGDEYYLLTFRKLECRTDRHVI